MCSWLLGIPCGTPQAFTPGAVHFAWVTYEGTSQLLQVFLSNSSSRPQTPSLVHKIDILSILGTRSPAAGFTGGSGCCEAPETHLIHNFSLTAGMPPPRRTRSESLEPLSPAE